MQSKLGCLMKAQYLNQSTLNALRYEPDPKKKHREIAMVCVMVVVVLMLAGYSFGLAFGYGYLDMAEVIPGYALAISSIVILFFTFIKTNGFLFAFRDYDILMSLPFSTKTIITGKFLFMYIRNLLLSLCVMLPMGIAYAIWEKPGVLAYVLWIVLSCFAPLLPMTIASALGALITSISSRFRFKVLVQAVISIVFVIAVMAGSIFLQGNKDEQKFIRDVTNLGKLLKKLIHKIYPMTQLFDKAVMEENVLYAIAFLAISIAVYSVFMILVSLTYKEVNSALMASYKSSNYHISKMKSQTVMRALVFKEFKRFLSSITYLMNVGIGMVLAIAGCIACLVMGIEKFIVQLDMGGMQKGIVYAVPFAIAVMLTMTCTTCVSLSLEGKNRWILESLPIEPKKIFQAKMLFNLLLLSVGGLICNICMIITMRPGILTGILYFVVTLATMCFSATFGMWAGIRFVNYGWVNEVEVIKQGAGSLVGMLGNMLLEIALTAAAIVLSNYADGRLVMLGLACILYFVSYLIYHSIMKIESTICS